MNTPILKSSEYIIQWLKDISQKYPHISFKYVYEPYDNTHYIFTNPIEEYLNGEFGKDAFQFEINDFHQKFPNEDIGFLSMENYTPEVDAPLTLYQYEPNNTISYNLFLEPAIEVITTILLEAIFRNKHLILDMKYNLQQLKLNPEKENIPAQEMNEYAA